MDHKQQEQSLDLQAMNQAKRYMGEFASGTLWLGLAASFAFCVAVLGYAFGLIGFGMALLGASFSTYAIYTVIHEAVHRSIQGKHRNLSWLNEGLGYLAGQILMIPFTVHRRSHLAHHANTNDEHADPDYAYHQVGNSIAHTFYYSVRSGWDQYSYFFYHCRSKASTSEKAKVILETALALSWRVALVVYGSSSEMLALLLLAPIVGGVLTLYFFAYLVHKPYTNTGRWVDTGTYVFRDRWGAIVDWAWLFQNYHAIHHLYPRVPFYRYRALFDEIENVMRAKGAPITYCTGTQPTLARITE